jgi:hypothetical protein
MANSPQLPMLATNSTVKAWCHTGVSNVATTSFTTNKWDAANFVDGYNLRLDPSNWVSPGAINVLGKALKFSFITPMRDTKYKIFIQPVFLHNGDNGSGISIPAYAHALNSTQFPKLTTSFWIRLGTPRQAGSTATVNVNQVRAIKFESVSYIQIRVVVL